MVLKGLQDGPAGGALHDVSKTAVGNSQEDSELYWNMRYQATADGALERILLDSFDRHRAMMARNTVRVHTKVLEEPPLIRIETMLANAKALLGSRWFTLGQGNAAGARILHVTAR